MLTLRRRDSLHHTEGGWFSAYWHFSSRFCQMTRGGLVGPRNSNRCGKRSHG
jgi:hypothetical protein